MKGPVVVVCVGGVETVGGGDGVVPGDVALQVCGLSAACHASREGEDGGWRGWLANGDGNDGGVGPLPC